MRPTLGEDDPGLHPGHERGQLVGREAIAGSGHLDSNMVRQVELSEALSAAWRRREDDRDGWIGDPAPAEPDVATPGHDDGRRLRSQPEGASPLPERRGEIGREVVRGPGRAATAGDRARTDEQDVRDGSEEGHDEAIRLEEAADHPAAGFLSPAERDDTVDGRHEVDEDRRTVITKRNLQRPAVSTANGVRHRRATRIRGGDGPLPERLQAIGLAQGRRSPRCLRTRGMGITSTVTTAYRGPMSSSPGRGLMDMTPRSAMTARSTT
jgi:hypothetical protein